MARNNDVRVRHRRRSGNPWMDLVLGLAILAAGVIFWLDHLGRIEAAQYLPWWPIAVIAFGLAQLPNRQWVSGGIWTTIGVLFALPLFGYPSINVLRLVGLWPLVYCLAGAALLEQALRRRAGAGFHALAVMAGNVRRLGSQEFTGGEAIAVMGACEIDVTASRLSREAVIEVLTFWGGIGIRVPRGWRVVPQATAILGGFDDKTDGAPDGAPQLVIRGSIIMGGVEVRHDSGEDE